jgi:hypothetical protein
MNIENLYKAKNDISYFARTFFLELELDAQLQNTLRCWYDAKKSYTTLEHPTVRMYMESIFAIHRAIFNKSTDCIMITENFQRAQDIYRYIVNFSGRNLTIVDSDDINMVIRFLNGSRICIKTSPNKLRGLSIDTLIVDNPDILSSADTEALKILIRINCYSNSKTIICGPSLIFRD